MKLHIFINIFATLLLGSCATHQTCDDSNQDIKTVKNSYPKRYKAALVERDALCQQAAQLKQDTTSDGTEIRSLLQQIAEKNKFIAKKENEYNSLKQATGEQLTKLHEELLEKQIELNKKEGLLVEKEQRLRNLEQLLKERNDMLNTILGTLRKTLEAFPKDELNIEIKNGKIYISMMDKLLFKSGSASVEKRGVEALNQLAPVLANYPNIDIVIEGHTDSIPIKTSVFKDNWDLSTSRATSVLRILLNNKINAEQLTASGKGEFSPVATNETAEGKALNRRTELVLTPKLDMLFKLLETN